MKILFASRADLYNPRGGDTFQMEKTREAINKLYPDIKIDITTEVEPKNINQYDILHIFNLDWICESYPLMICGRKYNKKIVLSAIHHSEKEVLLYEKLARYDIRRIYNLIFRSQATRDMFKNLYRSFFCLSKLKPTLLQFKMNIRTQQKQLVQNADVVLVQTQMEAEDIKIDFGVSNFNYQKVVNGIDADLFLRASDLDFIKLVKQNLNRDMSTKKIILNVGRIEPRKNQLALIQAFNQLKKDKLLDDSWVLVFIGDYTSKSLEYKYRFKKMVDQSLDIIYLGKQPQSIVASAMSHPGIYVHPSWFETTGLVCMEAIAGGMQVITAGDRLREYFGDLIKYCSPDKVNTIKSAILALKDDYSAPNELKQIVLTDYSWTKVAHQTVAIYKKLIKND